MGGSTFLVTAFPIELSGEKLVLELLKNVSNSLSINPKDYSDPSNSLALKDELTNLFNRRYVDDRLSKDIAKAFVEQSPMSVIFLDVDNLKEINDSLGHAFGDKVLIDVADIIMRSIRSNTDWVARYGGDEFVICLNKTDANEAFEIAERVRNKVAELVILQNNKIGTTVSLGIYSGQNEMTVAEVISFADKKMYEAKRNGKNCTMQ
jgi:diguanylate cyclase (GGDEF)-like protein